MKRDRAAVRTPPRPASRQRTARPRALHHGRRSIHPPPVHASFKFLFSLSPMNRDNAAEIMRPRAPITAGITASSDRTAACHRDWRPARHSTAIMCHIHCSDAPSMFSPCTPSCHFLGREGRWSGIARSCAHHHGRHHVKDRAAARTPPRPAVHSSPPAHASFDSLLSSPSMHRDTCRPSSPSGMSPKTRLRPRRLRPNCTKVVFRSADGERHEIVDALVVPLINTADRQINWSLKQHEWAHLNDTDVPNVRADQVTIIMSVDFTRVHDVLEIRRGSKPSDPKAELTPFGWTLFDQISNRYHLNSTSHQRHVNVVCRF